MNIIIINGSPTLKRGMTHQLISNFTKGAESAGAKVEQVDLQSMKLKFCTGCMHCFFSKEHLCVHKDGMADVHQKILAADYLVLASPVYSDGVTGQMKVFMDRFVPLIDVRFELVDGRYRHIKRFEKLPNVALLSVAGFYEMENFEAINAHIRKFADHIQASYVGAVLRPSSYILGMDGLMPDEVSSIKNAIMKAGEELVTAGSFSEKTLKQVMHTPLDKETWLAGTNAVNEKCLEAGKYLYWK